MRYLSLFSGIEAATQAWQPFGWECAAVSEIEPFPCAVLEHHYPNVPNLGDVTKITEQQIKDLGQIDLIVFGSPCQNLSVAGNRQGLAGTQSGLFYDSIRIIRYAREHCGARFALWENVPGAFSSNKGADFAAVVEQMAGLSDIDVPPNGWGKEGAAVGSHGLLEWSVLDAQWFGLAQRRKRVFAIVDFGDWASRPPILLERESLRGDSAPSRETRQGVTADVRTSTEGESWYSVDTQQPPARIQREVAPCLAASMYKEPPSVMLLPSEPYQKVVGALCARDYKGVGNQYVAENKLVVEPIAIAGNIIGRTDGNGGNGNGFDTSGACYTLTTNDRHAVAYPNVYLESNQNDAMTFSDEKPCTTLVASMGMGGGYVPMVARYEPPKSVVRRLTPIECERLQGFPDDFTKIPYRNKPADDCSNGVRYKALGNSMAVNVMAWIGKRIELAATICY